MTTTTIRLKQLSAALFVCGLVSCGGDVNTNSDFTAVDPTAPVSDWELVWSDEFEGNSIDSRKWTFEVDCRGGGNNEQQCYTDSSENAFVSDGTLKIVALPAEEGAAKPYTSARLNTKYQGDWTYGRIEVRAKMPSGQGSWPAIWMLPTDNVYGGWPKSGEIDIVEAVNLKTVDSEGNVEAQVHGTLHYGRDWPNNESSGKAYTLPNDMNPADDFHTYAIEWQEGEIRWYVDDYLYQTQMASEVRTNSRDEVIGLRHRGWFAEYFNQITGDLEIQYNNAPFDQRFHLLLNLAVGGNWPENVNNLGIDAEAFVDGQVFEIDYVRVYECASNPLTGKGCETVRAGYKDAETLVEGKAPIPSPPSTGVPQNLTIFAGTPNPNWPAWDCCGGSTPQLVEDADRGNVYEFVVGPAPTVNGFVSRSEFIDDPEGSASPFDASPIIDNGSISFDLKIVSAPRNPDSTWLFKVESNEGSTEVELPLAEGMNGEAPTIGVWQTYTFPLQMLADAGLDLSAIDVIMIFPAWDTGDGAVYLMDQVQIADPEQSFPELVIFDNAQNLDWPMWDCCGGSVPIEVMDDEQGIVAEFAIGAEPTVMGFNNRSPLGSGVPFDASALLSEGVVQFDLKVVDAPANPDSTWLFKIEADNASSDAELPLSAGNAGQDPVTGQWQTYTFSLQSLSDAGLDISAIDVLMVFPAWDTGNGAVYRMNNVRIYNPNAGDSSNLILFSNDVNADWTIWDCCGGSTPTVEMDDDKGPAAQFVIGSQPTVMGFLANEDVSFDATAILSNGAVSFDMKIVDMPNNPDAAWLFKIESVEASTEVELPLAAGGDAPVAGEWQHYSFSLQSLFDAGLDISAINVIMVFPAWGDGEGAVYRMANVEISNN
ncbi:family 16 glycosylhydrolase [Alkalimonas collagenimarina]|uniref:Family 16 glycosylhydrolase n=1 Tax=Alkalimonas collagenimarina TaxID=400390 RepID=A0ABT9GYR0_9GAMM|nr:glycoside hydrolase family 16 protein [Alkalimonas collagenimarina]MDP4536189.1 family 16 glycosylhydrolase [Alkalimonas collagenimarina]